ncbi:uncharacterized protein KGF55_004272 [Candida pseudojiufengensis]|uniref:uncharacterized protein n=1 Tax=Candida pseudojiufengensis TaxID=497109 RepID=UPI002224C1BE|nr:uncharacterized protein KGF55_004272 [Candida pseudojiufengensis]KAI5961005.1 hypothetical protein KGF55_004272 [Candida pseudojiufengensis]
MAPTNSAFQNNDIKNSSSNTNLASYGASPNFRSPTPSYSSPKHKSSNPLLINKSNSNSQSNLDSTIRPSMQSYNSTDSSSSNAQSYDDHISQIKQNTNKNVDLKTIGKHLVSPEDSLKQQGGDITRRLYHQMENVDDHHHHNNGEISIRDPKRRARSSSFSTYLEEARRGSTASDINVPGGFRREFLIQKSIKKNEEPPNFLSRNFMEFLSMYGHFAGEDFNDEDDEEKNDNDNDGDEDDTNQNYEDVFDEESSLLPNERRYLPKQLPRLKIPPKGTASVAKTYFLLFKALVGSGVLFLPRAFYNGGLAFSMITLSAFGLLTFFSYIVLIQSKRVLKVSSFGELGYKTYGNTLKYCILVSIMLSQIGFVATYILFTAENMIAFIDGFLSTRPEWLNRANAVLVQCVLLIPLTLIRNLTKLSVVSLISSGFIVIGLLIIFYFSGLKIYYDGLGPNIANFNSSSWTLLVGISVISFEAIGLILPIEASMAQPEKFTMVLSVSMFTITAIFVTIGTIGYTAFGDKVKSIIILNLPHGNLAVQSILVLYSIAVFLSAPLQLFPAVKIGESIIFRHKGKNGSGKLYHSGKHNPQVKWLKNAFRAVCVVIISVIAYMNADNIDKFASLNGNLSCIPLIYVYAPMIHYRSCCNLNDGNLSDKDKRKRYWFGKLDCFVAIFGVIATIYNTYQTLYYN